MMNQKDNVKELSQEMRLNIFDYRTKIEAFETEIRKIRWKINQLQKWELKWERAAEQFRNGALDELTQEAETELFGTRALIKELQTEVKKLQEEIKQLQECRWKEENELRNIQKDLIACKSQLN